MGSPRDAVIVEAARTPLGRRKGALKNMHPVVLSSLIMRELVRRAGIEARLVDDVLWGCVCQIGEQGVNLARSAWLAAGFPVETPATMVDRQCGSSQEAIHFAANLIASGVADVVIAGGVESMSRVHMLSNINKGPGTPFPPELTELHELVSLGIAGELVARKYGISRRAMDEFSVESHARAHEATERGWLRSQILPLDVPNGVEGPNRVERDEGIRRDISYQQVALQEPAFDPEHSITAANSSQVTDGAAGVLLMSAERAAELEVAPRARVVAQRTVGCDPVVMLDGGIQATSAVLDRAGLELRDIDLFEVNEAFASVVLAWSRETGADLARTNVNGGAIALGHPWGASGARLMCHLLYELERRDAHYGLQAMCSRGGIGTATIIERRAGQSRATVWSSRS